MQIKAQALINAFKWIEDEHGQDGLRRVLAKASPAVRDRYIGAIAIEWHPQSEFVELLHVAESVLGGPRGKVSKQIGAEGARINTRGMTKRAVMYLASPEFLLRRIATLWSQFNDRGEMRLLRMTDREADMEISGLPDPDELFCATITGWSEVIGAAVGFDSPRCEHVTCCARGDATCVWRVAFAKVAQAS